MDLPRTVYAIKHNKTNRVYIGSSKNPDMRVKQHIFALRGGRHTVEDMQADFDKFGEDYEVLYLEVIKKYSDRFHEYDWMEKYKSYIRGVGYNYKDRFFEDHTQDKKTEYRNEFLKLLRDTEDIAVLDLILKVWKGMVNQ